MARLIFDEIVGRSDYGIDLHTASVRRTNFPNVRADMTKPEVARIAKAFGCEIILNGKGPEKSLRREAAAAGCPTIILEAGEVWKVERAVVEYTVRGVISVLSELGMVASEPCRPAYEVVIEKTSWVRASHGGFLGFHVSPGDVVHKHDPLATNSSLTGVEKNVLLAPFDGVVLGMTTLPSISPGDPVCHLGRITSKHGKIDQLRIRGDDERHDRAMEDLSTNVHVVERVEDSEAS
jgi:predicted deacylase